MRERRAFISLPLDPCQKIPGLVEWYDAVAHHPTAEERNLARFEAAESFMYVCAVLAARPC
jgi:hypothetical protein